MTSANRTLPATIGIIILAALIYWPSLGGEFIVDDRLWATQPAPVLAEVLNRAFLSWGFNESVTGIAGPPIFRPVANLLIGVEHWAFGDNPLPYRLVALLLHSLNAVLVLALLARLFPSAAFGLRLWGAILFLAHPALVESVAWISASAELFMTSFVLAAVLFFLRATTTRRATDRAAFAVFAVAAILSKEAALALPLILVLVQHFRRAPLWAPEIIGAAVMVAAYLVWRQLAIGNHGTIDALAIVPTRTLAFALAHFRYLALPGQQPFSVASPGVAVAASAPAWVSLGLLFGVLALALRFPKDWLRPVLLGLGWISLALWPAYAIALVGDGYFAGRHAYLPAVGLAILATALFSPVPAAHRPIPAALAVASAVTLAGLSFVASGQWSSNLTAYQRAIALSPQASGPWTGLGQAHLEREQFGEAAQAFQTALSKERNVQREREIRYLLALALAQQGRLDESSRELHRVTQLDPRDSSAWNGLGNNAWAGGRPDLAEQYYREALRVRPDNDEARSNLSAMLRARAR